MNIIWIVNTVFPDLAQHLGKTPTVLGGWMYGSAKELSQRSGITLTVITTHNEPETKYYFVNNIHYYLVPSKNNHKYDKGLEKEWVAIFSTIQPDVVHIHGTEYSHGLAAMNVYPAEKFVISIQGLVSVYARYFLGGISQNEIKRTKTLRDYFKGGLLEGQKQFEEKGKLEIQYIEKARHIIGRTFWDYTHSKIINPAIDYHFCNETLRDGFYKSGKWDINTKKRHQIFLSQAGTPIKGVHKVLEALNFLKDDFNDIKIRIGGHNIIKNESFFEKMKMSGYGSYIKNLIKKYQLEKFVEFTGLLDEKEMIREYLSAHIFICPSSIENSPNSVGEAQILGTPVISSYVGGTPDMIEHKKNGLLYRFEETEMLSQYIRKIFNDDDLAQNLSANGILVGEKRHSLKNNIDNLVEIYYRVKSL